MKQTQAFLSTYTADVSGVCSALFELGGMTVMHDASGCNSTYNTHDEPRWYDMDSLVFISGLSELEAVLGDDEKLIEDTVRAAKELSPRFIALAGTPIPMITGCDLAAIAREIESRSGVPSFFVPSNGIGSYVSGAGQALRLYAERFVLPAHEKKKNAVNILGVTPLDFSVNGQIQSIARRLTEGGYSAETPAALVYKATWPEEACFVTTIEKLAQTAAEHGITKTAIVLVGDVIAHAGYEKSRLYAPDFETEFRKRRADS